EDRVRGPLRPRRPARREPRRAGGHGRPGCRVLQGDPDDGQGARHTAQGNDEAAPPLPANPRQGVVVGLHDRLKTQNGNGTGTETLTAQGQPVPVPVTPSSDPYAELKTRIHHEVIAKLGAELFKKETTEDLT